MMIRFHLLAAFSLLFVSVCTAKGKIGATIPWITYEAETMKTTGVVLGPKYEPHQVETESSGQQCVKLTGKGQYVEFTSTNDANSLVIRYSLPNSKDGKGLTTTLGVYKNGLRVQSHPVSSRYSWLYGKYPFVNDPGSGKPRNFYDEVRLKGILITKGDVIKIQRDDTGSDDAEYCIIDLADLEKIPPPVKAPVNALSVIDKAFGGENAGGDYTESFRKCIAQAVATGKSVWIPEGDFQLTGDISLPANLTLQGAGMWYTTLVGDESQYGDSQKRVRLKGNGSNIHLSDFAIVGRLNYRNDREANDGIVGSFGTNSTISRVWIEHTKVGIWVENSQNLRVTGCRLRNTIADGINFCVGMRQSTIANCTARGTGDDCFAIWPAVFTKQEFAPGHNLITHCTAQLPFLANGAAIYGGESNKIQNCSFKDISPGSAILLSTTFPTENTEKAINNNFTGTTVISDCNIASSGGFDHTWDWRGAVEVCIDKRSISGIDVRNVTITNSLSNGFSVIAKNGPNGNVFLTNVVLQRVAIQNSGVGFKQAQSLFVSPLAGGELVIRNSTIPTIEGESKIFVIKQVR